MKILYLIAIYFSLLSCNKSVNQEDNNLDYLNYVDEDIFFQESSQNPKIFEGWACNLNNGKVEFSGKVYLVNGNFELLSNPTNDIHSEFNKFALITSEEYFLKIDEKVDNPCEYYKDIQIMNKIFYSPKSSKKWFFEKEVNSQFDIENYIINH